MINKRFEELGIKEKFRLQGIVKKYRKGLALDNQDQQLYDKFIADFEAAEKKAKGRWPIIIGLLIISLLAVMRQCT